MTTQATETIAKIKGNGVAAPSAPTTRMTLGSIVRGKLDRPVRVLLYGTEKVGKSTFASNAPSPIFLCSEDGTSNLDVARFPEPHSYLEVTDALRTLGEEEHEFKTLVVDTLDWMEPMIFGKVLEDAGKQGQGIESIGYGKGYTAAVDMWRDMMMRLDMLRNKKGMNIILLAHAWIKPFQNPLGENFDRYELKMNKQGSAVIKEWVDAILFANYEILTYKKSEKDKAKGVGDGARIVHTQRRDAFDAGNRYNLPETIPLSWDDFWGGVVANTENVAKLRAEIEELMMRLPEKAAARVKESLATSGDNEEKLAQLLNWATTKVNG